MQNGTDTNWPHFVRTPEAARLLDLSPRTLEKHRSEGTGPVYHKLGGRVVYAVSDLHAWIDNCVHRPASETATNTGTPRGSAVVSAMRTVR